YHIKIDFKYVDDIKQSDIIRRLGFNRRPRAKPVSEPQSGIDPSGKAFSGSLSSVNRNETRNFSMASSTSSFSVNRRKPPLPPSHSSSKSISETSEHFDALHFRKKSSDGEPPIVTWQPTTLIPNPLEEKTLVETQKHLDQEKSTFNTITSEIYPRRRLASFAGPGSNGGPSPHTSWDVLNHTQSQEHNKGSKLTDLDHIVSRSSPKSCGRVTPVTTVSPLDLQLVRDQMVVALERLKDMEEQVKIIPLLQVKISVLEEEKKQLIALVKKLESQILDSNFDTDLQGLSRERAYSTGSTVKCPKQQKDNEGQRESVKSVGSSELNAFSDINQFKQLNAKKELNVNDNKNIAVLDFVHTKSVMSNTELELEIKQQTIQVLRDKVKTLELELKEALIKAELCRLKSELQDSGAHTHAAKNHCAQPRMQSIATQTGWMTRTIAIGNHVQLVNTAVGEEAVPTFNTVGVICQPKTSDAASGLDTPIEMWVIQKKVEKRDQCVGTQYVQTFSQGVGTSVSVCDVGILTLKLMETGKQKKTPSRTVGCGDWTVDGNMVTSLVSQGIAMETVRDMDIGEIMTLTNMSRCTNTDVHKGSQDTCTFPIYDSKSSIMPTNMQERHTNTVHIPTRTLGVGDGKVIEQQVVRKMRSIAVGTPTYLREETVTPVIPKVMTRDTGVGLANINENFLVGLRTRNIACGPSRLPDPYKTRSIGVEADLLQPHLYAQTEPGLDHYINQMQRLLKEQQSLLTSSHFKPIDEVSLQDNQATKNGDRNSSLWFASWLNEPYTYLGTHILESIVVWKVFILYSLVVCGTQNIDTAYSSVVTVHVCNKTALINNEMQPELDFDKYPFSFPCCLQDDDGMIKSIIRRNEMSQGCAENRKTLKSLSPGFECLSITPDSFSEMTDSAEDKRKIVKQMDNSPRITTQSSKMERIEGYEMSDTVISACHKLKTHLDDTKVLSNRELRSCLNVIQQDWFFVSSQKTACPETVESFQNMCRHVSPAVLSYVANMADRNGNSALHYSVSHSNFRVVQKLLDAGVCNANQQNKAGYTPIMLAALASVESKEDMNVVGALFRKGDVNSKAIQAGQTALMLAVSHGRIDMVKVLLASGSKVNIQDDEGSTALMCASEHGNVDIVRLLLAQPGCDASLTDNDDSTAMSIALDAGHNDIAMLLYAHMNYGMGQ
ncbi:KN motif and ankyrin repeat domain-containing protein 1 isoform X1, partial [Silurus asotus]